MLGKTGKTINKLSQLSARKHYLPSYRNNQQQLPGYLLKDSTAGRCSVSMNPSLTNACFTILTLANEPSQGKTSHTKHKFRFSAAYWNIS